MTYKLIDGDPMEPCSSDLIAQTLHLPLGEYPPNANDPASGWRVLTGSPQFEFWGRLAYRYEIEEN